MTRSEKRFGMVLVIFNLFAEAELNNFFSSQKAVCRGGKKNKTLPCN